MENKINTLISIGFMGIKQCYLNIPKEEAIERYKKSDCGGANMTDEDIEELIDTFEFNDEFGAYHVWE